jgi:predicted lipoprotein
MIRLLAVISVGLVTAAPLSADTQTAISDHIVPRYTAFEDAAQTLADQATTDCTSSAVSASYHAAYDAWINVSHIQFGPIETRGTALALAFWPDTKDRTGKAITRLIAEGPVFVSTPDAFKDVSVAAQGFPAFERLLTEKQTGETAACALRQAVARFIAQAASDLHTDWKSGYAEAFARADVQSYKTPRETRRALYTALSTSLAFLHDQRLGRPLGTFDRPRPTRAEARRSGRSQRHIVLSLYALKDLAETAFADAISDELRGAFDTAIIRAEGLDDPSLAGVANPAKRLKIEVLQRAVRDIQVLVAAQIAGALGITAGFNSLDGD